MVGIAERSERWPEAYIKLTDKDSDSVRTSESDERYRFQCVISSKMACCLSSLHSEVRAFLDLYNSYLKLKIHNKNLKALPLPALALRTLEAFEITSYHIALSSFPIIKKPCVFLQNLMIRGLSNCGLHADLLHVYIKCRLSGCPSDDFTFPFLIKACSSLSDLRIGREIHCVIFRTGYHQNLVIQTALVDFYAKKGEMLTARLLFDQIPLADLVSCNTLMAGYSFNGLDQEALETFRRILTVGLKPNVSTFSSVIPVCTRLGHFCFGKSLHGFTIKSGYLFDDFLVPALISMYAGDLDLSTARKLFDSLLEKNASVWNAMISAYTQSKKFFEAFEIFRQMIRAEMQPDLVTFVSIIPSCENYCSFQCGESLTACVIKNGLGNQPSVLTALLSMYAKLGNIDSAKFLFDQIPNRNLLCWNAMMSAYVRNRFWDASLAVFRQMQFAGLNPDAVSIISVLSGCSKLDDVLLGKSAHAFSLRKGIVSNLDVLNALLMFYSDGGQFSYAFTLFHRMSTRSSVSWNTLISRCVQNGAVEEAVILLQRMQKEGVELDMVTLISFLPNLNKNGNIKQGMVIHGYAIKTGCVADVTFLNALITMYCNCGSTNDGRLCLLLFQMGDKREISLWNAIISVYVQTNKAKQAVAFFTELLGAGLEPDNVTVLSIISAGVLINSLNLTHSLMAFVIRKGLDKHVAVSNALMDSYVRCGNISMARKLFGSLIYKDAFSWSVMINGYGLYGDGEAALELFKQMQLSGVRPNEITYLGVLSACSHAGLVEQSKMVFKSMVEHGISQKMEHYACMVDLLGRTGHLNEAFIFVKKLPCKPSVSILESLLGACRIHGNVELGEIISGMLFEMDPENPGSYVMLHNIYASAGRWEDAYRVRSCMKRSRLKKVPGFSLVGD
ncbi:hypothetical protein CISIN_1g045600mg [Citrus sinensis]|uniref:Pentacotripeptide-repeat region of PRORP domain-containing protein n=1 Tax=Citrus sinensis TaxID=2711 RepID=A0A067GKP6_CITSI|nr:hypothetical protein CISIN_1g045600mg [Citrus sinensis]